jgi:type II secretory pathway pseudopilin PulG
MSRRAESAAGFALVELLVAFAVAILLLGAMLESFVGAVRGAGTSKAAIEAVLLAESALDQSTADEALAASQTQTEDGRFTRRLTIRPMPEFSTLGTGPLAVQPYAIEVDVSWNDRGRRRNVVLRTIRLRARL